MRLDLFTLMLGDLTAEGEQVHEGLFAVGFHKTTSFSKIKNPASIYTCKVFVVVCIGLEPMTPAM